MICNHYQRKQQSNKTIKNPKEKPRFPARKNYGAKFPRGYALDRKWAVQYTARHRRREKEVHKTHDIQYMGPENHCLVC